MHKLETVADVFADPPLSRKEQTRNKAAELFAKFGFGQVSLRKLAAQVGIHQGSLYNHFESKECLLFDLIEETYETLLAMAAQQRRRYQEPESQWKAIIEAHLALHQHKGMYLRVAEHEYHNLSQPYLKKAQRLRQRYEEHLLALLIQAGAPSSPFLSTVAQGIVSLLNTLPSLFDDAAMSTAERLRLIAAVAHGSVTGALKCVHPCGAERMSSNWPLK
jgi:AcrR family transcriptional regulator